MADKISAELLLRNLVQHIKQNVGLASPLVEAAFRAVPRHLFLPHASLDEAYADAAVPLKYDSTGTLMSSASQPSMIAIMLDQAGLVPGHNVMEIGTAYGYNAALIQNIVGNQGYVTTIEIDDVLARQAVRNLQSIHLGQVRVVTGDGAAGYAPRAAYDRIIATAGVWDVPASWWRQLKPDGRLVVPIWLDGIQVSAAFEPEADGTYYSNSNHPCSFVYLRGDTSAPEVRRQVGSSSLWLLGDDVDQIDTAALHALLSDGIETCHLESPQGRFDLWHGFQIYLMLHEPPNYVFTVYQVAEDRQAYGVSGFGLGLFTRASAIFTPYNQKGMSSCFGGSEAFMKFQDTLDEWNIAGQPDFKQVRLRLIPITTEEPTISQGKLYRRQEHWLHVWLDLETPVAKNE